MHIGLQTTSPPRRVTLLCSHSVLENALFLSFLSGSSLQASVWTRRSGLGLSLSLSRRYCHCTSAFPRMVLRYSQRGDLATGVTPRTGISAEAPKAKYRTETRRACLCTRRCHTGGLGLAGACGNMQPGPHSRSWQTLRPALSPLPLHPMRQPPLRAV